MKLNEAINRVYLEIDTLNTHSAIIFMRCNEILNKLYSPKLKDCYKYFCELRAEMDELENLMDRIRMTIKKIYSCNTDSDVIKPEKGKKPNYGASFYSFSSIQEWQEILSEKDFKAFMQGKFWDPTEPEEPTTKE